LQKGKQIVTLHFRMNNEVAVDVMWCVVCSQ